ncbi:transforming growth factor-beta-induced protein ig-h3-like isoform X2 [Limulus polyphemus]|uniref:Transforming growth factor-beta-induced protein ig-h3-like isoform X2 n=1 Tax=Limulus polyphemus TaxID=6850 RepID=A0ABM1TAU6_LIMPO|nr:transforming growth factor-beta-induced protein ig-h3-like isoform X2 [Limulus polyphemus]
MALTRICVLLLYFMVLCATVWSTQQRQFRSFSSWDNFHRQIQRYGDELEAMQRRAEELATSTGGQIKRLWNGAANHFQNVFDKLQLPLGDGREVEGELDSGVDSMGNLPDLSSQYPDSGLSNRPVFDPTVVVVDTRHFPTPGLNTYHWKFPDNFNAMVRFRSRNSWWQGPNICEEKEEINEQEVNVTTYAPKGNTTETVKVEYEHFTKCKETETSYICITRIRTKDVNKTYIVKRQCCHGFMRLPDASGCLELDLKDIVETMTDLGTTRFVELAARIGLEPKLREDNFTIFCPSNEALIDYEEDTVSNEIPSGRVYRSTDLQNILNGHITEGYLKTGDLEDELVLMSVRGNSGIRVNIYNTPEKIVTANCARIVKANNYARNGVIHVVDTVLPIPSQTVADIISSDPQFSTLKQLLSEAGLVQTLRDLRGHYTLFAPTDAAFLSDAVQPKLLEQLLKGDGCVSTILKNHILPNVLCSTAIPHHAGTINLLDKYLTVTRNEDNKLFVNNIQIIARDIVGINGIVHIIDGVLVPSQADSVTTSLEKNKMIEIVDLIDTAELRSILDSMKNATFFVPSKKAIQALPEGMKKGLKENPQKLRELLMYHVAQPIVHSCKFHNNQMLKTKIEDKEIRINIYSQFTGFDNRVTAQCARVVSYDNDICEGTIHVVDKVLIPPKKTIMDQLEEMEGFDILVHLLRETGMDERLRLGYGPFTLLAPKDEAFSKISESVLSDIYKEKEHAENLVKLHVLPSLKHYLMYSKCK